MIGAICRTIPDGSGKKKANDLYRESCLPKKIFDESRITSGLRWQLDELKKADFKNGIQNIVIVGECGTGKTSLAVQIAREAIQKGASAVYSTEEDLVISARRQKSHWHKMLRSDLIVLDELFYLKPSEENLQLLYRTVMFLSETRSFIFVTNRSLSGCRQAHRIHIPSKDSHGCTINSPRVRITAVMAICHCFAKKHRILSI